MHPGFVLAAVAAAGAYLWWSHKQASDKAAAAVGTPDDPNYAWAPGAQAKYDSAFNGLLSADTKWKIVDDYGAIHGLNSFTPTQSATDTGILTPFTPFTPEPSLLDNITSFFGG